MKTTTSLLLFAILPTIFCEFSPNLRNLESISDTTQYLKDQNTCTAQTSQASSETCTSVTTGATGTLSNKCCYLEYTQDMARAYKLIYGDDWENKIQGSSKELDTKICLNVYDDDAKKKTELYSVALTSTKKEVNYNCKENSGTFKTSDFNPKNQAEKIGKEIADCSINTEKSKCLSNAKDFDTSAQCCWFSLNINGKDKDDYTLSSCIGVEKVGLEYFSGVEAEMLKLKTISKDNDVTNYKFTCTDKNGKSANGTYEYKLG